MIERDALTRLQLLIALLAPAVTEQIQRSAFLALALHNHPLHTQINQAGSAHDFILNMLQQFANAGGSGRTALEAVLLTRRAELGVDKQAEIDSLILQLDTILVTVRAPFVITMLRFLNRPLVVLLAVIIGGTVILIALFLVTRPTPDPLTNYDIGLIITHFAVEPGVDVAQADALIDRVATLISQELTMALQPLRMTAGYRLPIQVQRIEGTTPEGRRENAAEIATQPENIGADIVVYGTIRQLPATGRLEIEPEYYIVPASFEHAVELIGEDGLGSPIAVPANLEYVPGSQPELDQRATILVQVFAGLTQFLNYIDTDDLRQALGFYNNALTLAEAQHLTGREVIYLLIGWAHLRIAEEAGQAGDQASVLSELDEAAAAFNIAKELEPTYGRADVALANVALMRAGWTGEIADTCNPSQFDPAISKEGLIHIEQAKLTIEPNSLQSARLSFAEARLNFQLWMTSGFSDEEYGQFSRRFEQAFTALNNQYDTNQSPLLEPMIAPLHGHRAMMLFIEGQNQQAIEEFERALGFESLDVRSRLHYLEYMGDVYIYSNNSNNAQPYYERAFTLASELESACDIARLESKIDSSNP